MMLLQSMKFDASKLNVAIPAALIPFAVPFATIAAEGTGRVSVHAFNFNSQYIHPLCCSYD